MKFGSLKPMQIETVKVRQFDGGLNLADAPYQIGDNQLTECKNMRFDGGALKRRKGLAAVADDLINTILPTKWIDASYRVHNVTVSVGGKTARVVTCMYYEYDSLYTICVHLLTADGEKTDAGQLVFSRTSSDCFYVPEKILFFSAEPVNGGGLFAMVTRRDRHHSGNVEHLIYEINSNFNAWSRIIDFYVPIVLINGRGTRYEEANSLNSAYCGTPKTLESPNLLNGQFKAYYTSDGASSCFRLPFSGIDNSAVNCRIYSAPNVYWEWTIASGATRTTARYFTADITMNIDREKGIFYFTDSSNEDFPIINFLRYHENNICVTAAKDIPDGAKEVFSSTCCTLQGDKLLFSGGSKGNRVFCCNRKNPLYFPLTSSVTVGEEEPITALAGCKDGVAAFKENEVHWIKLTGGKALNTYSLVSDDDSVLYDTDTLSSTCIRTGVGCQNGNTIAACGGFPIWLGTDGRVYALKTTSKEIFEVSAAVAPFLEAQKGNMDVAFAVADPRCYLLMWGDKAVVMDYRLKKLKSMDESTVGDLAWYTYDFEGIDLLGGIAGEGKMRLICRGSDHCLLYSAGLSGNTDTDICLENGEVVVTEKPITANMTTGHFTMGGIMRKKIVDELLFSLSCDGILELSINGKLFDKIELNSVEVDSGCGTMKTVRVLPHLFGTKTFYMTLCSDEDFALGEMNIGYRMEE